MRHLFLLALVLAICVSPLHAMAEPPEKVTIAQFGKERFMLYLPLYVATEEGLFAKQGLDVDLKFAGNDDQVFASVISGSADFGVGDPVFTAISHDKGGPGKVVAMLITRLGLSGVAKDKKMPQITNVKQLDGLRISSFAQPSTTYTLLSEIKRTHKLNEMQIVQAPFGAQIALLEAGKADIATDIEPSISIAEDKGYPVVFQLEKFTDPQVITGLTTTEETIAKRPGMTQKVVLALQQAVDLIYSDPNAGFRTARKIYPTLSDKVIRAAVARMLDAKVYPRSIIVPDNMWQRTLKTRLDSGELKKPQDTGVSVDNSFAAAAAPK